MRRPPPEGPPRLLSLLVFLLVILCNFRPVFGAGDTITSDESIGDVDTLLSGGGIFRLGFFTRSGGKRYLGIWYEKISQQTVVWVANRQTPLTNATGVLKVEKNGTLALYDGDSRVVWSSTLSGKSAARSPVAQLLDTGNLVVREATDDDPEKVIWQSFDYPSDTLLPGMKLGWDLKRGLNRYLRSWKGPEDPSPGDHSFRMQLRGSPQLLLMNQSKVVYRSGPWNGVRLSGVPEMKSTDKFTFEFVSTDAEVYYAYEIRSSTVVSRLVVSPFCSLQRFVWLEDQGRWNLYWWAPKDQCDNYAECGAYGICDSNYSPVCICKHGFRPRSKQEWELRDGTSGCERDTPLDCRKGDEFVNWTGMKLPDASQSVIDRRMGLEECTEACRRNCSCTAYAIADVRNRSGCIMWTGELTDLREYMEDGQDLFVRVAASVLGDRRGRATGGGWGKKKAVAVIVSVSAALGLLLLGCGGSYLWKRKAGGRGDEAATRAVGEEDASFRGSNGRDNNLELPLFDFSAIAAATDNFSEGNKLGEGGFGPVYRGKLEDGQGIAVKRLSRKSAQGLDEFRNEVSLIAKLQHRNLVRLLGCCIDGEERILVYEYMHNKGLDSFVFDKTKGSLLNWQRRFNIIQGIARGLLYLHQDSRFRIIHRDLKASNILLDSEMNPKISDFGAARIFFGDREDAGNTRKVVGTYGYMSPEYAMDGVFSVKSDVFSFGVLVIEIISGRRNRGFYYSDSYLNLLLLAWRLWKEGKSLELLDGAVGRSYSSSEVMRCIHVALLCVQERAEDRPTMSTVVVMLSGANPALRQPHQPGYCMGRSPVNTASGSARLEDCRTVNEVTVTMVEGR